jgi:ribosomal protein L2
MGGGEGRSQGETPRSPTGIQGGERQTRRRRKPLNSMIDRRQRGVLYGQLKL